MALVDYLFTNNGSALLASAMAETDTSLTIEAGKGDLFPAPMSGEIATLTLFDELGNREIVTYTSRLEDTFSGVTRATEGTIARAWPASTPLSNRLTAAAIQEFLARGATYAALDFAGDIGTGANQIAQGDHLHDARYEQIDAQLVRRNDTSVNFLGSVSVGGSPVVTEGSIVGLNYFESAEFSMPTSTGVTTATHGLGAKPSRWAASFRCKVANNGFSVGDEIEYTGYALNPNDFVASMSATATALRFAYSIETNFQANNPTTGAYFAMTPASNWRVVLRAWK